MSIRKERIKFENQDINLKITLNSNNYRYGYQQEIDGITEEVKNDLINPIIDNEIRKFKYESPTNSATKLNFYFTTDGSSYENTYTNASTNFEQEEIINNHNNVRNSFYIMDYYDSFDFFNQNKIFTIYNTKITNSEIFNITTINLPIPNYRLFKDTKNQFKDWYIPKSLIDDNLNSGKTIVIGYIKFSFYNAKTGELLLFYNKDKESIKTSEKLYFKVKLDLIKKTWYFEPNTANKLVYQIPTTNAYSKRTNETINNFNNKQQEYPEGNVFNPIEQNYDIE